ncbi:MauE/DoxX family redox-associated membrane protein [Actinomadura bangladeshensis]|uniref:Methylamine utilization protein MauE n=1 Tax=Actinomadura bangladeshensis TaxID=453573 RepID=A0A4V6PA07_9ACTN|nr:MauE/DoxX family redox-associated membrane protein [Actinomadura bangladeshensis]TDC12706.1 methylamine utilization protein MauE [Actinomadura bangladeshensis]
MQYVALTARCALGLIFLVAVAGKLRSRDAFREFRLSVPGLAPGLPPMATSVAVVAAESAAVVLLALPWTAPAGLALAGAVLLAFAAGVHRALRDGRRATCRCFGTRPSPIGRAHVVRNLVLTAVAWGGLAAQLASPGPVHPAGAVIAVAGAAVLTLVSVFFDELADLLIAPSARIPR